tara:strand:- start:518 stop:1129 length:612 start_codon:yes stop_codon:yes gene_type:complete
MSDKSEAKNNDNIDQNQDKSEHPTVNTSEEAIDKNVSTDQVKLKDLEEKLLRALAEQENQRRRFEKEIKDAFEFGGFNFAKETLSILDNLQRAKLSMQNDKTLKESKEFNKFLDNIEILEKDLVSIFEKNNIKKIHCVGKIFDPNFHQAMLEIDDENSEPGKVIQEIQPGYTFGDRLLRPSFVGVSKKKAEKSEKKVENKDKE